VQPPVSVSQYSRALSLLMPWYRAQKVHSDLGQMPVSIKVLMASIMTSRTLSKERSVWPQ